MSTTLSAKDNKKLKDLYNNDIFNNDPDVIYYKQVHCFMYNKLRPIMRSLFDNRKNCSTTEYGRLYNNFIEKFIDKFLYYSNITFRNVNATNVLQVANKFIYDNEERMIRYYLPYKLLGNNADTLFIELLHEHLWQDFIEN